MFKTRVHEQDKHRENSQARLFSRLNNNKNKRANMFKEHIHEQEKPNKKSQTKFFSHQNNNGSNKVHLTCSKHASISKQNQVRGAK